ncbi:related to GNAT family N-acetyltransferase [Fusarium torulosum]|uniref:Related to GNAT family N-acetyltransferase n=1 Tax=Fusarium torulosum TaxID=33205 RepID=A0AAE8M1R4_9HYPO|nr:related to GNAT family N-acetyltransferase [Fusarium torulosum]
MSSATSPLRNRSWRRDSFLISTDPSNIPIARVVDIFASDEFYWAKPLPEDAMKVMLESCLCFALYDTKQSPIKSGTHEEPSAGTLKLIGIARGITDFTTFFYLTDVWVDPTYRGQGLGKWLVKCVREVTESMPHLRKIMLATGDWERTVPFYESVMDMKVTEGQRGETRAIMERRGRGHPKFGE